MEFTLCPLNCWTSTVLLLFNVKYAFWNLIKALDKLYLNFKSGIKCFAFFKCISKHTLKYYPRTYSTNFFYKNFVLFIMYWNKIFPITYLPRGLGLNFFSLVTFWYTVICISKQVFKKLLSSNLVSILKMNSSFTMKTNIHFTVDDFGQIFVLLKLKVPRRQFHPRFHFFLAVLMLLYHTSLITFLRSSPNRFYPALKFEIYQKLAKIAKITIFRAPLSLFRDELGLS